MISSTLLATSASLAGLRSGVHSPRLAASALMAPPWHTIGTRAHNPGHTLQMDTNHNFGGVRAPVGSLGTNKIAFTFLKPASGEFAITHPIIPQFHEAYHFSPPVPARSRGHDAC